MEFTTIKYRDILDVQKVIKPNYHLNYGKKRINKAKNKGLTFSSLKSKCQDVFTGGIFKRVFVENSNFGLPYISAQNMMNSNPREVAKIISKKYTPRQDDMVLKENQILVSCAGTIGNVRLITKDLEGIIGSQDIIRIIPDNEKLKYGYLYAYLASPTAYNYMQSFIYGSVVPRIEPNTLSRLPIPLISKEKQQQTHDLIIEASKLRVEANKLLEEAINEVENQFILPEKEKYFKVNIKKIFEGDKYTKEARLEADFYETSVENITYQIKSKKKYDLLGDLSESVTISNLRARKFVKEGVILFTGQSLGLLKPDISKQLSKKFTANIEKNTTIDGDILISAFGTLGKVEYCYKNFYTGIFASQQIARIRPNDKKIHPGYLYIFFKTKIGQKQILKYKTGSVIEWANWNNFSSIPIPIPNDKGNEIGLKANKIAVLHQSAYDKETQAIEIIENEISSWQK